MIRNCSLLLISLLATSVCVLSNGVVQATQNSDLTVAECLKVKNFLIDSRFLFEKYSDSKDEDSAGRVWIVNLVGMPVPIPVANFDTYEFNKGSDNGIRLILRGKDGVFYSVLVGPASPEEFDVNTASSRGTVESESMPPIDLGRLFEVTPDDLTCDEKTLHADSKLVELLQRKMLAEPPGQSSLFLRIVKMRGTLLSGFAVHGAGSKPDFRVWYSEFSDQSIHVMWVFKYRSDTTVSPNIGAKLAVIEREEYIEPPWWTELSSRIHLPKRTLPIIRTPVH